MKIILSMRFYKLLFFVSAIFLFSSCEKEVENVLIDDTQNARLAYTEKGYTEVEINPIIKQSCYFEDWDKTVMTPVSGLYEYYDANNNWVASIDLGNGECDEWATKTWNVSMFAEYPSGTETFSVFKYGSKKD